MKLNEELKGMELRLYGVQILAESRAKRKSCKLNYTFVYHKEKKKLMYLV